MTYNTLCFDEKIFTHINPELTSHTQQDQDDHYHRNLQKKRELHFRMIRN